jgi:hypothetical protein
VACASPEVKRLYWQVTVDDPAALAELPSVCAVMMVLVPRDPREVYPGGRIAVLWTLTRPQPDAQQSSRAWPLNRAICAPAPGT